MTPRTNTTFPPPVMEARRWIEDVSFPDDRPLINVSQAAPVDPPPRPMRQEMARLVMEDPQTHLYGPVLGLPALRSAIAARWTSAYGTTFTADQIVITSGCNQAFCAAIQTLTCDGDEVILPTPWYFNHKMWLDMAGVTAIPLPTGPDMLPDPDQARALITPRTRAIALVSPNNPAGVEYPPTLLHAFFDIAQTAGIALILDETYRDFHSSDAAAHDLFASDNWGDTLIQLYSFSKSYRLTGHRVGAMITGTSRLGEVEKFLDTVTICPAQLGQHAALWGLGHLDDWLAGQRDEILSRRAAIQTGFAPLAARGWKLLGCGAYFAYLEHPFSIPSDRLAQSLVREAGILLLPGTMFTPPDDPSGLRQLRVAFANVDSDAIATLLHRLAAYDP